MSAFLIHRKKEVELNDANKDQIVIAQWIAFALPNPAALGLIPGIPKFFSEEKIVDVAEVNQQRCLDESGQWLENVD